MNSNEIRISEGRAPYTGGEKYFVASNNYTPIDRLDEVIDSQITTKENKDEDKDKEKKVDNAVVDYLSKIQTR